MKKALFVVLLIFAVAVSGFAQINLGTFPLGKWLDANYDAYWNFSTGSIQIEDADGGVHYDFEGKTLQNFSVNATTDGIELSFYCVETEKDYTFVQPLTSSNLILRISRDEYPDYEETMPKQ